MSLLCLPPEILTLIIKEIVPLYSHCAFTKAVRAIRGTCKRFYYLLNDSFLVRYFCRGLGFHTDIPLTNLLNYSNLFIKNSHPELRIICGWEIRTEGGKNKQLFLTKKNKTFRLNHRMIIMCDSLILVFTKEEKIYYVDETVAPTPLETRFKEREELSYEELMGTFSVIRTARGYFTCIKRSESPTLWMVYSIQPSLEEGVIYYELSFTSECYNFNITYSGINFPFKVTSHALKVPSPCYMDFRGPRYSFPLSVVNTGTDKVTIRRSLLNNRNYIYSKDEALLHFIDGVITIFLSKFIVKGNKIYDLYDGTLLWSSKSIIRRIMQGQCSYLVD